MIVTALFVAVSAVVLFAMKHAPSRHARSIRHHRTINTRHRE